MNQDSNHKPASPSKEKAPSARRGVIIMSRGVVLSCEVIALVLILIVSASALAAHVTKVVEDSNNKDLGANAPKKGVLYRVEFTTDAGNPNIKDLHFDIGKGKTVGGPGSGKDLEVTVPPGWSLNTTPRTSTTDSVNMWTTGTGITGTGFFKVKIKDDPGNKPSRAVLTFTSDGNDDRTNGIILNPGGPRTPSVIAAANDTVGGFVQDELPFDYPSGGGLSGISLLVIVGAVVFLMRRSKSR